MHDSSRLSLIWMGLLHSLMHRCLQAWAYQSNAQVDDASHTSDLGFTIVENSLSEHVEDHLPAMPGHTSFSTGTSALMSVLIAAELY